MIDLLTKTLSFASSVLHLFWRISLALRSVISTSLIKWHSEWTPGAVVIYPFKYSIRLWTPAFVRIGRIPAMSTCFITSSMKLLYYLALWCILVATFHLLERTRSWTAVSFILASVVVWLSTNLTSSVDLELNRQVNLKLIHLSEWQEVPTLWGVASCL